MMKQRWWWTQVENKEASDLNFMWTQLKQNKFIEGLKMTRKTPFETLEGSGISSHGNGNDTTAQTITTLESMTECESDTTEGENKTITKKGKKPHGNKPGKRGLRVTGSISKGHDESTQSALQLLFTSNEITLMNSLGDGKGNMPLYPEDYEEIGKLRKGPPSQVIQDPSTMKMCNHLESNFHLANKKALLWNMKSYYEAMKENVFDYLPLTFHVRKGFEDKEYQKFLEYYNNREVEIQEQEKLLQENKEAKKTVKKLRNLWIVKPGENTNRGIGIHVCNELSQINEIIATTEGNSNEKKRTYLIQQYLDRPFLYNKRKFDIRCYILMTCINGIMKGYWYQEGYIRTASKEFSLKNVTNKLIHLTNDAVQKKAEEYGKFEAGNKLSYNDFQKYLDANYNGTINFQNEFYPQIRRLAIDCIKGVYGKMDPHRRENCFEVFGLDFMIDQDLKAWLIEVNTNPDINASSPALTKVIPPMVENALRLTIDQMFPPPSWQLSKKLSLPENLLENNKFELVFDEVEDGPALRNILQPDKGATGDLILEIVAEEEEDVEDENN